MRISQRLVTATVLIALSGALAGCGSMGSGWDPSDLLDFLDTKKKLPGERKPVFPEGVPGLQQGVPKELYKGNVEQEQQNNAALAPPPAEAPRARSQPKGRVNVGAVRSNAPAPEAAPVDPDAAPVEDTSGAPPAPKGKKIVRRRTTAPAADDSSAAPAAQPATTPFPAPVPSGTFTR